MIIENHANGETILKEVFSGVLLVSPDNEEFGICMRDSGFEFSYDGTWYSAKNGVLEVMGKSGDAVKEALSAGNIQHEIDPSSAHYGKLGEWPS